MFHTSNVQLSGRLGLISLLAAGLLLLGPAGCTQKVAWKPPDEPKVSAPPPEAPPRVDYQVFYVAADRLNLRACPGMDCPRITTLTRNQEVEKVGESQGWFQVRSRQDGTLGWVDARYLAGAPVSETATLPTETASPASPAKPAKPAEAKPETRPKARPAPVVEEEEEEEPAPRRRRVPEAQAAEPPAKPETTPSSETPAAPAPAVPAPAAPSDPGKKKIRIM